MALAEQRLRAFVHTLASRKPAPGGGSAAALAGALGAALHVKVCRIVLARSLPAAQRRRVQRVCAVCDRGRAALMRLVDEDARAYGQLVAVWRRPARGGASSAAALPRARRRALQAPLKMCEWSAAVLQQTPALAAEAGRSLGSDVTAGSALLVGGFAAAAATVAANLDGLGQRGPADAVRRRLAGLMRAMPSGVARR